jgi:hypothetical protein
MVNWGKAGENLRQGLVLHLSRALECSILVLEPPQVAYRRVAKRRHLNTVHDSSCQGTVLWGSAGAAAPAATMQLGSIGPLPHETIKQSPRCALRAQSLSTSVARKTTLGTCLNRLTTRTSPLPFATLRLPGGFWMLRDPLQIGLMSLQRKTV